MGNNPPGSSGEHPGKRKRDSTPSRETTDKHPRAGNGGDRSLSDLQKSVVSSLECPVCTEIMKSPILQCCLGHSFCSHCIQQVNQCPVCKSSVSNTVRNYSLERLSEQMTKPCPNQKHGCLERIYGEEDPHETRCPFRIYDCPLSVNINMDCFWKGPYNQISQHVQSVHHVTNNIEGCHFKIPYAFENEYMHNVTLVHFSGELFVSYDHYEKWQGKCWKAVKYLGLIENASKYAYQITFALPDNSRKITYKRQVHTEEEDIQTLFDTDDCFTITEKEVHFFKVPNERNIFYNGFTIVLV